MAVPGAGRAAPFARPERGSLPEKRRGLPAATES